MEDRIINIKETLEAVLDRMSIQSKVDVSDSGESVWFIVRTPEGGLLIGENGKTLISLHHLVKKIAEKQLGEDGLSGFSFSVDINDYRAKKIEDLKNLARVNAQRVRYFKKEVLLKPMTSFERRIIHAVLTDCPDIVTESRGQEPHRQVVIKPYNP